MLIKTNMSASNIARKIVVFINMCNFSIIKYLWNHVTPRCEIRVSTCTKSVRAFLRYSTVWNLGFALTCAISEITRKNENMHMLSDFTLLHGVKFEFRNNMPMYFLLRYSPVWNLGFALNPLKCCVTPRCEIRVSHWQACLK